MKLSVEYATPKAKWRFWGSFVEVKQAQITARRMTQFLIDLGYKRAGACRMVRIIKVENGERIELTVEHPVYYLREGKGRKSSV